jgi:hypothetical protein
MIKYIEKLRVENNIQIKDLCQGIVSVRNYSRYLSEEADLSFDILAKMLDKFGLPIYEFGLYINNSIYVDNIEEIHFIEYIINEMYEEAYKEMYPKIKDKELKTDYAYKSIPIAIEKMLYKLNKKSASQAKSNMREILNMNKMTNSKVITTDDVNSIDMCLEILNEPDIRELIDYLRKVIITKEVRLLTTSVEATQTKINSILLSMLCNNDNLSDNDHILIKQVFNLVLEYNVRARMDLGDIAIFKNIYSYMKRNNLKNDLIIYHYALAVLSSGDDEYTKSLEIELDEADKASFIKLLQDKELQRESMYERLMADERI